MNRTIPRLATLPEYVYHWVDTTPDAPFLRQPYGSEWKVLTYKEALEEASKIASYLKQERLKKGAHVAIYSKNCYHWILADLAIMIGGFVSIPLYHNLSGKQLQEVLSLSDAEYLFVGKLDSWTAAHAKVEGQLPIMRFPHYDGNAEVMQGTLWDEIVTSQESLDERHIPKPDDLWTILFTSGTTGSPKGVMHVHRSPARIVQDDLDTEILGIGNMEEANFFSYLPLNHVAEKIGIHAHAIVLGGRISFGESIDTFIKNLQDTQPTLFFAVPRIWTKFYQGVTGKIPLKLQQVLLRIPGLSNYLKKKIKTGLGLGQATIIATGAAITPVYLKKYYKLLGIHLIEAYGMTEVCGPITYGADRKTPFDSVGKAITGAELKVDPESNEILMKTPYMMQGYYNEPALTDQVLQEEWLSSGDQGSIDADGNIKITGRISDAFKTSKGKYILPARIEELLGDHSYIEQICVAGIGIAQPIGIINLTEVAEAHERSLVEEAIDSHLELINAQLSNYERLSTLIIDTMRWNTENALITPTLKIRRKEINQKYAEQFRPWQDDKRRIIWI